MNNTRRIKKGSENHTKEIHLRLFFFFEEGGGGGGGKVGKTGGNKTNNYNRKNHGTVTQSGDR